MEWMLDDVRSRSYFALLSPTEQATVTDAVMAGLATVANPGSTLSLPYVTAAYRYRARRSDETS